MIHQNGSGCDYVTEDIVRRSKVEDGRLVFHGRSYKAIVLPQVESLHIETAKQLLLFVRSGGTVLFVGATPRLSAGLDQHVEESAQVLESISTMRASYPLRSPLESVSETNMVDWYRTRQGRYPLEPDVLISTPTDYISQIHYRNREQDIFFFHALWAAAATDLRSKVHDRREDSMALGCGVWHALSNDRRSSE